MTPLSEEDLETVVTALPDFVVLVDDEGRFAWVNRLDPSLRPDQVLGHRIDAFDAPRFKAVVWNTVQRALAGEAGEYLTQGYQDSWYRCRVLPLPPDADGKRRALVVSRDETERVRAQQALERSADRFRRLVESSPDIIVVVDAERRVVYGNRFEHGASPEQVLGARLDWLVDEAARGHAMAVVDGVLAGGPAAEYEAGTPLADARFRVRVLPWSSDDGEVQALLVATDITAEHRAAEQRRRMHAELDHRVKNMLALVVALASQTARRSSSLVDFQAAFQPRLAALAETHEALAAAGWHRLPLESLVRLVLRPFADDRLELEVPAGTTIGSAAVTPLALALHELATNAAKYGALASTRGRITVSGEARDDEDRLTWTESGVVGPQRAQEGLGLTLVRALIERDLGGRVELSLHETGRTWALAIPRGSP